jgi:DNA polymerase theta
MQGVLHETSFDVARSNLTSGVDHASSSLNAGQKRSRSINDGAASRPAPASLGSVTFQRASSLPLGQPQLRASTIRNTNEDADQSDYSQRRQIAATPTANADPELTLGHAVYQLPRLLIHNLATLGIKEMYPWQKTCLQGPGLLDGSRNLVYCAPTGGGKSLVADGSVPFCLTHNACSN